jgi:hypothetical protein
MDGAPMSDSPKPSEQPLDVPGPLPELPSLDPLEPAENEAPADEPSRPVDVPIVQPGTQ